MYVSIWVPMYEYKFIRLKTWTNNKPTATIAYGDDGQRLTADHVQCLYDRNWINCQVSCFFLHNLTCQLNTPVYQLINIYFVVLYDQVINAFLQRVVLAVNGQVTAS